MLHHHKSAVGLSVPSASSFAKSVNSHSTSTSHAPTISFVLQTSDSQATIPTQSGRIPTTLSRQRSLVDLKRERVKDQVGTGGTRSTFGDTLHVVTQKLRRQISLTKRGKGYSSLHEEECTCGKQQVYGPGVGEEGGQPCRVHFYSTETSHQNGKTNPME